MTTESPRCIVRPGTAGVERFGMCLDASKLVICWECEVATSRPIAVTIELPPGHPLRVPLCPPCYRTCYLPLVAEAGVGGADVSPPTPIDRAPHPGRGRREPSGADLVTAPGRLLTRADDRSGT